MQRPPAGVASNPPNNVLRVRFPSVTDGTGSADAAVTFEFFVPKFYTKDARVLPANKGDDALSVNNARAEGDWTPIDRRDPSAHPVVDPAGPEHTLMDKSIAIQKSATIVTDVGPAAGEEAQQPVGVGQARRNQGARDSVEEKWSEVDLEDKCSH